MPTPLIRTPSSSLTTFTLRGWSLLKGCFHATGLTYVPAHQLGVSFSFDSEGDPCSPPSKRSRIILRTRLDECYGHLANVRLAIQLGAHGLFIAPFSAYTGHEENYVPVIFVLKSLQRLGLGATR